MTETVPPATGARSTEQLSSEVVSAIADVKGVDPIELPPLYDVVDPDALNRLFQTKLSGGATRAGRVTFAMAGCEVVVTSTHRVTVTEIEDTTDASGDYDREDE